MITLPAGFNYTLLVNELFSIGAQFAPVVFLVAVGFLVLKILKRA